MQMKTLLFSIMIILLASCKLNSISTKTQVPNMAYIQVVGDLDKYKSANLFMQYNDQEKFSIELQKEKPRKVKLLLYDINPGTHDIKIYSGNKLITNTKAFISNQETKKIILP